MNTTVFYKNLYLPSRHSSSWIWIIHHCLHPSYKVSFTCFYIFCKQHTTLCILLLLTFFTQHVFEIYLCYAYVLSSIIFITRMNASQFIDSSSDGLQATLSFLVVHFHNVTAHTYVNAFLMHMSSLGFTPGSEMTVSTQHACPVLLTVSRLSVHDDTNETIYQYLMALYSMLLLLAIIRLTKFCQFAGSETSLSVILVCIYPSTKRLSITKRMNTFSDTHKSSCLPFL